MMAVFERIGLGKVERILASAMEESSLQLVAFENQAKTTSGPTVPDARISGSFALWFEDPMLRWFPSWVMDLSTTIHFWEAVLAGLSILIWHLYGVIYDPVVYPVDPAWVTGRSAPGRAHERLGPDEHLPKKKSRYDKGTKIG